MPLAVEQGLRIGPFVDALEIATQVQAGLLTAAELQACQDNDPETLEHQRRVGGLVLHMATQAGMDLESTLMGVEMGGLHDIGKQPAEYGTVWTPERIAAYREQHTCDGDKWVYDRRQRFGPLRARALRVAARGHHSTLPEDYQTYAPKIATPLGFLHLLTAADRFDAFWSRDYTQRTGAGLTPAQVLDEWVIDGRPHHIPPVAVIDGHRIDIAETLTPLLVAAMQPLESQPRVPRTRAPGLFE